MKGTLPRIVLTVVLIIAVSAVITTVSFTAFYYFITRPNEAAAAAGSEATQATQPQATIREYPLDEIIADLADKHYVKTSIVLQYPEVTKKTMFGLRTTVDDTLPNAIAENIYQIRDIINSILREQVSATLRGAELEQVKAVIIAQINQMLATPYGIVKILFPEMVIT